MLLDDPALARAVRDGDRAAEKDFAARLLTRVRAWARHRVRDAATAEDVAQEAVWAVIESLREQRIDDFDRLGAFVASTCRNVLGARLRGEKRRAGLLERFGSMFDGIAQIDDTAIDRTRLADCFERLAPRAQTLLALTFVTDAPSEQIATELGVSVANVRVLRHRALQQLHGCVEA